MKRYLWYSLPYSLLFLGLAVLVMGISSLLDGGLVKEGQRMHTTAVVTDVKEERVEESRSMGREWVTRYSVYLDFSDSDIDPELSELLVRRLHEMRLGSSEKFHQFYTGQTVTVEYHVRKWHVYPKTTVVIESVDGFHPSQKSFDWHGWILDYPAPGSTVRPPVYEMSLGIQLLIYASVLLVGGGVTFWLTKRRKGKQSGGANM